MGYGIESLDDGILRLILAHVVKTTANANGLKRLCRAFRDATDGIAAERFTFVYNGSLTCIKHYTRLRGVPRVVYDRVPSDSLLYSLSSYYVVFDHCQDVVLGEEIYKGVHTLILRETGFDHVDLRTFPNLRIVVLEYYTVPNGTCEIEGLENILIFSCQIRRADGCVTKISSPVQRQQTTGVFSIVNAMQSLT